MHKRQTDKLERILLEMKSVLVGFSGGVDSTFLLAAAQKALEGDLLAVTVKAEFHTEEELTQATEIAKQLNVEHKIIHVCMDDIPHFTENPKDRCYHCKTSIFGELIRLAKERNIAYLVEGSNVDDEGDYRPGMKALSELGIRSPLREAGLTKQMIRDVSKDWNLPTWEKPSAPCLATRFPYDSTITLDGLRTVDRAESIIRNLGIDNLRVRLHGNLARIEVEKASIPLVFAKAAEISKKFKKIGIKYVTLDMDGFRSGAMNEVL